MEFRQAKLEDLPKLKKVYRDIIQNMEDKQISIWDEIYPCEFFQEDIEAECFYVLAEGEEVSLSVKKHQGTGSAVAGAGSPGYVYRPVRGKCEIFKTGDWQQNAGAGRKTGWGKRSQMAAAFCSGHQ